MGWFRLLLYPAIRIWVGWLFCMYLDGWWIKSCMNGVLWSSLSMFLWWLPGVGFVFLWFTTSPPPPGFLTDLEISKLDWIAVNLVNIKLTFDVLGENPLYVDIDCYTVLTSLPSPAGRGSCGWVELGNNIWGTKTEMALVRKCDDVIRAPALDQS